MAKKMVLGRGLGALIEDANDGGFTQHETRVTSELVNEIDLSKIDVNPFQPRSHFDEESLNELAESIRKLGIIQPITVRQLNDRFQLITGERRFRASKIAGLTTIPAYVRKADDQGMLEMALVENIQRQDLDSIEIAISYQRLIEECNLTQEDLGGRVGKKRATVTNYLRLLKLPVEIQAGIRDKLLTMGHARAIISIDDSVLQLEVYKRIIAEDLSVRQVESLVKEIQEEKPISGITSAGKSEVLSSESFNKLKSHLEHYFNTRIDIKQGPRGTGKIIISFRSEKEVEEIAEKMELLNL
jgi:ParB-like partition proteins